MGKILRLCVFQDCYESGSWTILEPIMLVEVNAPEEFQGVVGGIVRLEKIIK